MKSNQLLSIIGAGGHTRAVIGLLMDNELPIEGFYDTNIKEGEEILGIKGSLIEKLPDTSQLILAIGNNEKRQTLPVQYISSIYVSEEVAHYVTVSIISYKPIPIEYINMFVFVGWLLCPVYLYNWIEFLKLTQMDAWLFFENGNWNDR